MADMHVHDAKRRTPRAMHQFKMNNEAGRPGATSFRPPRLGRPHCQQAGSRKREPLLARVFMPSWHDISATA
jgi:hypothetical protein